MQRPTNFYPEAPKLASFQFQASHLRSLDAGSGNAALPAVAFQPLTSAQYADYLLAFTTWKQACDTMDVTLHNQAVKKRVLEGYREVATLDDVTNFGHTLEVGDYVDMSSDDPEEHPLMATITMEKKTAHPPVLSTHPHRGEKRDKKRKLRDARVLASVHAIQAKTELVQEKTVGAIKTQLKAVEEVKALAPLRKAEVSAAKSAETRAASLMKSSPQFITEVKPDDGWKVVLHKKDRGPVQILRDEISVPNMPNGRRVHTTVSGAGTSPADLLRTAGAATRLPTAIRS